MTTTSAPPSTPPASERRARPFALRHVLDVDHTPEPPWMIEPLWFAGGVGILGGEPKLGKTFVAAELALAVAGGGPAFGRFEPQVSGPVIFYGPEDGLPALRRRFEALAAARGRALERLPLYLLDTPRMFLDRRGDLSRMRATVEQCRPRLLVLDPFVRLVAAVDENSAGDVSAVLGSLRALERDYQVAVLLVHHSRKSPAARPAQALRGSGDFAAWSDTNLFLSRTRHALSLQVEHRHAPPPEPLALTLATEPAAHLALLETRPPVDERDLGALDALGDELLRRLARTRRPLSTVELRQKLRKRKADVVRALDELRDAGRIERTDRGWVLTPGGDRAHRPRGVPSP